MRAQKSNRRLTSISGVDVTMSNDLEREEVQALRAEKVSVLRGRMRSEVSF